MLQEWANAENVLLITTLNQHIGFPARAGAFFQGRETQAHFLSSYIVDIYQNKWCCLSLWVCFFIIRSLTVHLTVTKKEKQNTNPNVTFIFLSGGSVVFLRSQPDLRQ